MEGARAEVGGDAGALEAGGGGDGLHPHRLPDAGGAGVVAVRVGVPGGLLAAGLRAVPGVAGADHDHGLVARAGDAAQLGGEGVNPPRWRTTSVPLTHTVASWSTAPKCSRTSSPPLGRDGDRAAVPDGLHEVGVADPGQLGLRAEGHDDLPGEVAVAQAPLQSAVAAVGLELPAAVQVQPRLADELGPGVLGTRDVRGQGRAHTAPHHCWCAGALRTGAMRPYDYIDVNGSGEKFSARPSEAPPPSAVPPTGAADTIREAAGGREGKHGQAQDQGRRGVRGRLGEDGVQRPQRLRARLRADPRRGAGGDRRPRLPGQHRGPPAAPGPYGGGRAGRAGAGHRLLRGAGQARHGRGGAPGPHHAAAGDRRAAREGTRRRAGLRRAVHGRGHPVAAGPSAA